MKQIEIFGSSNTPINVTSADGDNYQIIKSSAQVCEWLRERPINELLQILDINISTLENYHLAQREKYREMLLKVLSFVWFDRETDIRLTNDFELFPTKELTIKQIKNRAKADKITASEAVSILDEFIGEDPTYYCKHPLIYSELDLILK